MKASAWLYGGMAAIAVALCVTRSVSAAPDSTNTATAPPTTIAAAHDSVQQAADVWADSVMATLSLRERVAQLMVPRLDLKADAAGIATIRRITAQQHIGGLLLGKGTLRDYATLINEAQAAAKVPLLVTCDGEWGPSMRVTDAPRFPYNMTLGAITDPQLLYDYGQEVGRECRELGITVDFAPVLDVNSNPSNPVIGYRSFGESPERVAILGEAFAHGMESAGVLSVAKHFPGHGDTSSDSHKTLPTVTHSRSTLDATDLVPFRSYIASGLGGIMVGHLNVPSLDKSGTPASLSAEITTGFLKNEMGFKGLVFTDALAMKGAVAKGRNENNCITALRAGADVLLCTRAATDIDAVTKAVEDGDIPSSIIDDRCRKVLRYKYLLGLSRYKPVNIDKIKETINSPEAESILTRLADASITVLYNRSGLLPVTDLAHRRIAVVTVGKPSICDFARYCAKYAQVDVIAVSAERGLSSTDLDRLNAADIVIAGIFTAEAWARSAFARLRDMSNLVTVSFLNPYKMAQLGMDIDRLNTLVAAYEGLPSQQRSAAEALFGGIAVSGRFPVNVNGVAPLGAGIDLPKVRLGFSTPAAIGFNPALGAEIDSMARAAVKSRAVSGCQVVVAKDGRIIIDGAWGKTDFSPDAAEVDTETLFDLASVTKTNATLAGLMKAYDEGLFQLDDSLWQHIEALDTLDKGDITVTQLLFHESGMPAYYNYERLAFETDTLDGSRHLRADMYSDCEDDIFSYPVARDIWTTQEGIDRAMGMVHSVPLGPRRYNYSCLNFMLLKEMLEQDTGVDLDQWIDTEIYGPLGAWHSLYLPLQRFDRSKIAATELDHTFRRQHIHGYVHDEMASLAGGVSGNAGLFSTAEDVAKLAQMWLNHGNYGGEQIISEKTARLFTETRSSSGRRGLGFDLLRHNRSLGSDHASPKTYGHTGFTGTCFWIDPDNNLIFVFLGNRVNPSRQNKAWDAANPRGRMLRAVYDAMRY